MRLSVLDQSPIRKGGTAAQALRETLLLAEACDRLGYHRYWVAEHHNSQGLAGSAPEMLIGQIAARTRRIRAGSGGVMLSHYSPLKVAEQFRVLEALFPGRIDLGVGRAPGSDHRTAAALTHGPGALGIEHFGEQLQGLEGYLTGALPPHHPFRDVHATPEIQGMPELWMLGSTGAGASYAAQLGWSFCFAHFITPEGGEDIIRGYKHHFCPSAIRSTPRAALGVSVTCAETDAEAERLAMSRWVWRLGADQGRRGGVPSPEEAAARPLLAADVPYLDYMRTRSIYGSPSHCRTQLEQLAERYDAEELVVVTITYDFAARIRSYELLAEVFGLGAGTAAGDGSAVTGEG